MNDLLDELQLVNFNHPMIFDRNYHLPALADDIACIALSPGAIQSMLDTASIYASNMAIWIQRIQLIYSLINKKKNKKMVIMDMSHFAKKMWGVDFNYAKIT